MAAGVRPSGSLMFCHNAEQVAGTRRPSATSSNPMVVEVSRYVPLRHRVPPFLFLQGRDPRRNGHGLNAPRLPDRDGGGPTPILAQVYADYRLAGGRRDLPASLQVGNPRPSAAPRIRRQLAIFNLYDKKPCFQAARSSRAASRSSSSCLRNSGEMAVRGLALRMVCH